MFSDQQTPIADGGQAEKRWLSFLFCNWCSALRAHQSQRNNRVVSGQDPLLGLDRPLVRRLSYEQQSKETQFETQSCTVRVELAVSSELLTPVKVPRQLSSEVSR